MFSQSLKVLCVEDSKTTQLVIEAILAKHVKELMFADDGEAGYEAFMNHDIDLVLSDYEMPRLNGLEMIKKIREHDDKVAIVLVTHIDDVNIIIASLNLHLSGFVRKPVEHDELLSAVQSAAKIHMADKFLEAQKQQKIFELESQNRYHQHQEDLAFQKELNIIRNDFYYQMLDGDATQTLIDFVYQPLDVMSGDAYTARRIDEYRTVYVIADGMGKGLSASLSSMIMLSFINHLINRMKEHDSFSFDILVQESMDYIKPILLEEETLSIDYILFDNHFNKLHYAKFAMPVFLLETLEGEVIRIRSNNLPMSKWNSYYKIDKFDISAVQKFLFYSDGVVENSLRDSEGTYADCIEADFQSSFTREELRGKIFEKIADQEDDITLIFIHKLSIEKTLIAQHNFATTLDELEYANQWYTHLLEELSSDASVQNNAALVFTELYMNAYEHGNLKIDTATKHRLLEEDTYFETLEQKEQICDKQIIVSIHTIEHHGARYMITQISDEGDGFDTQMLSSIFRNAQMFNGKGVFVSRKNSMGIYYNIQGNRVLYINKL